MAIKVNTLSSYMEAGISMLITGPAGTGKTQMVRAAAENLDWRMKYFNTATLDVFTDLIGIPVPDTENKRMDFYRPEDVDEAEVIFFDELNRASTQTLNTVFEVLQFGSLNGKKLKKLKCVVAAMNPVGDGYLGTEELDEALADRFRVYLSAEVKADYAYFKEKFGAAYAQTGIDLFTDYQSSYKTALRSKSNKMGYFSPRRLEILMDNFKAFPKEETIKNSLPADVVVSPKIYAQRFNVALNNKKSAAAPAAAPATSTPAASATITIDSEQGMKLVEEQLQIPASQLRKAANMNAFKAAVRFASEHDVAEGTDLTNKLLNSISVSLAHDTGPTTFAKHWTSIVSMMNAAQQRNMTALWKIQKREAVQKALGFQLA